MIESCDIAIVGGGPAGQAAALSLNERGLRVVVIDEQLRPGGQILRQPPREFDVGGWMKGRVYAPLRAQLRQFEAAAGIEWWGGRSVLGIARIAEQGFALTISGMDGVQRLSARRVLVAAGSQDLAVPLPGWTLPGVYAAGGIQAFVKSQKIVPGSRVVLAGTHPLQLLIAAQIVAAGGTVEAVLFAQRRMTMTGHLLRHPLVAARHAGALLPAAEAMTLLRRRGVPVHFGVGLKAILGKECVTGVTSDAGDMACDTVGLCYGFVPQSALPRMVGARTRPAGPAGGWATDCDPWMRSSVPGLYVAGETTGVAGAPAAMIEGRIAGAAIAIDCDLERTEAAEARLRSDRREYRRLLRFAGMLDRVADPREYFPAMDNETLVCRCEDVSLGTLQPLIDGASANAIKLASRCGMGPCQGRNCEPSLVRLVGDAADPGFTARFPARPVSIGDLAAPR